MVQFVHVAGFEAHARSNPGAARLSSPYIDGPVVAKRAYERMRPARVRVVQGPPASSPLETAKASYSVLGNVIDTVVDVRGRHGLHIGLDAPPCSIVRSPATIRPAYALLGYFKKLDRPC